MPKRSGQYGGNQFDQLDYDTIRDTLIGAFKRKFKPEFVNRIDVVTVFHPLSFEQIATIAKMFIGNLNKRLKNQGASLKVTESALKYLIYKGYNPEYGARPLRRLIEQEIEDKIAEYILSNTLQPGSVILISERNNSLVINFEYNRQ